MNFDVTIHSVNYRNFSFQIVSFRQSLGIWLDNDTRMKEIVLPEVKNILHVIFIFHCDKFKPKFYVNLFKNK